MQKAGTRCVPAENIGRLPDRDPGWQDSWAYLTAAAKDTPKFTEIFGTSRCVAASTPEYSVTWLGSGWEVFGRSSGRNFSGATESRSNVAILRARSFACVGLEAIKAISGVGSSLETSGPLGDSVVLLWRSAPGKDSEEIDVNSMADAASSERTADCGSDCRESSL
jgi:hypothetical protein